MVDVALAYRLSKRHYYADFLIVPVATSIAVIWLYSLHAVPPEVFASSIATGIFGWTFAEYGIHRWIFHGWFLARQHVFHHLRPHDYIGASSLLTTVAGALAFWFLTLIFGPAIGVGLLVGFVLGYLAYISIHDRFHHAEAIRAGSWMAKLNANHEYHHRRFKVNFGVTSPIWDMVFGTYQSTR